MRKNKFFMLLLLLNLLFLQLSPAFATDGLAESDAVPTPPELTVDAAGAILLDAVSGDVLYTKNADQTLYPASTTKLMTALLVMKYGDVTEWIAVPEGIYQDIPDGASTANLKAGEEMYVYELLQCLMIVSANEAANALAIYISGSVADFVDLMNQEAQALGCENTHFVNTNGLHDEEHYTTARDLAKIACAALEYNLLMEICSVPSATIRETNLSPERILKTTNYLLEGSDFPLYQYPGAFGIKTGFTTPAGCCLVAGAYVGENVFLSVVLGANKYTENEETITGSFIETAKLFDWGYENYDTALVYENYLASLPQQPEPEPTPSPSPSPPPSPSPSPTPEPSPSPSVSVSPSPTPEPTPTPVPIEEPVPEETPAPVQEDTANTLLRSAANALGVSVKTLLFSVIGIAGVLLVVMIVLFIHILKHSKR